MIMTERDEMTLGEQIEDAVRNLQSGEMFVIESRIEDGERVLDVQYLVEPPEGNSGD